MKFIAYFDYLGFKDFLMLNDMEYQQKIIISNFTRIEDALAHGKKKRIPEGVTSDLSNSKLNCVNFSDTVIFYTKDDSQESFLEIMQVAYRFNWQCIDFFFPVRGCVYYGEFKDILFESKNEYNGIYRINSIFGDGLLNAYNKAEDQAWAGTVIDNTVCEYLKSRGKDEKEFLSPYAKLYNVPYKKLREQGEEWVMHLVEVEDKLGQEPYTNMKKNITANFSNHKKRVDEKVEAMINNTLGFLESYT